MAGKKLEKLTASSPLGHQSGKYSGFERYPDGSIRIAPMYITSFSKTVARRQGINALVQQVSQFAATQLAEVAADQGEWWKRVMEDIGVTGEGWTVDLNEGLLKPKKSDEKVSE